MLGFTLIELLVSLLLLSIIACGTSQYFVWFTQCSKDNFKRAQAAATSVQSDEFG